MNAVSNTKSNSAFSSVKDITLIAILVTILFAQKQLVSIIPMVQLTVFFIILFTKKLGFKKTSIIILISTLLESFTVGSFNVIAFLPTIFGWLLVSLTCKLFFNKTENIFLLGLCGIISSLLYCWILVIPYSLYFNMSITSYFIADIPYEITMMVSSFISVVFLYKPLSNTCKYLGVK